MAQTDSRYRRVVRVAAILVLLLLVSAVLLGVAECAADISSPSRNTQAPAVREVALIVTPLPAAPAGVAMAAEADPPPGDPQSAAGYAGAHIRLKVSFGKQACVDSGELWIAVQWQDSGGGWHEVEGWQGTLDADGYKTWWVAQSDLGKGPFRWAVRCGRCGPELGTSAAFTLPSQAGETVVAEVRLP